MLDQDNASQGDQNHKSEPGEQDGPGDHVPEQNRENGGVEYGNNECGRSLHVEQSGLFRFNVLGSLVHVWQLLPHLIPPSD